VERDINYKIKNDPVFPL